MYFLIFFFNSKFEEFFSKVHQQKPVANFIFLRRLFFRPLFRFFTTMSGQTQPRVKKKRKNWSKGENLVIVQKARIQIVCKTFEPSPESPETQKQSGRTQRSSWPTCRTSEEKGGQKKKARRGGREKEESKTWLESKDVSHHTHLDRSTNHETRES